MVKKIFRIMRWLFQVRRKRLSRSSVRQNIAALRYANNIRDEVQKKADYVERQSTFLFVVVLIATVLSPVLILLPTADVFSKYLPAFLTVIGAMATCWILLRKPQERWVLYRGVERSIDYEMGQYISQSGEYSNSMDREKLLVDRISRLILHLHNDWATSLPQIEEISKLLNNK